MKKAPDIRAMFFPGIPGDNNRIWDGKGMNVPVMQNNAKRLDLYNAPYQLTRIVVDVAYWRQAIAEAERPLTSMPYRVKMQQIFIDTIQNGHVFACWQKRKNLVLLKKRRVVDKHGETDEEATKIVNTKWYSAAISHILDAQAFGYSLISFGDMVDGGFPKLKTIRRWEVSPDRLNKSTQPYIPTGIPFMDPDFKDESGVSYFDWSLYAATDSENGVSDCGYGYMYKCALYEIVLRKILGWNTDFLERYGQPTAWATTTKSEEERADLVDALTSLGAMGFIVTDEQDKIEFVESKGSGSGTGWQSYANLEERFKKLISSIILGHEDAITSVPGKLGSQQKEAKEASPVEKAITEKESTDISYCLPILNNELNPKLQKLGVKLPYGKVVEFDNDAEIMQQESEENDQITKVAQYFLLISQAGGQPDWDWFKERTGISVEEAIQTEQDDPQFTSKLKEKIRACYGFGS